MVNASYQKNVQLIAGESARLFQQSFNNLEASNVNMMSATLPGLMENENYKKLFMAKDKDKPLAATRPVFEELKAKNRITNWNFINPEPQSTVFLRIHKPEQVGDVLTRTTFVEAVKKEDFAAGKDLGKASFALRAVHPYYYNNKLIGYMELGEAVDHFLGSMRTQTGNEYGMLIDKKFLDKNEWEKLRASSVLTGALTIFQVPAKYLAKSKKAGPFTSEHFL
ncbi:MAG TPA: cache domain-containing protein [Candidatus Aquicultor sp.]